MAQNQKYSKKEYPPSTLVPVGALWKNKNGKLPSGKLDRDVETLIAALQEFGSDVRLVIFENTFAKTERDPIQKVYISVPAEDWTVEDAEEIEEAPAKIKARAKKAGSMPWEKK